MSKPCQTQRLDAVFLASFSLCPMGHKPDADTVMLHLAESLQICCIALLIRRIRKHANSFWQYLRDTQQQCDADRWSNSSRKPM